LLRISGIRAGDRKTTNLTRLDPRGHSDKGGAMSNRIFGCIGSALGAAGLLLVVPLAVHAQQQATTQAEAPAGGLEEIVVTAQRRTENAVDVPISITALSQEELTTANVQSLGDIQKLTPALRFDYQTGFAQPTIRGIGTGITTSGGGSNVGVYVDGFYSPDPLASDFQLLEVSSIDVLKGPQGTLFGHNTTGGAIVVTTADPTVDPHAEAKVSYGKFNSEKLQAYATGGFGIVAADIEGVYSKGTGFITNIYDGDSDVAAYENWTVRTGLKVQFTDSVSALFRYTHSNQDDPSTQMLNSNTDTSINPTTGQPWGIQTFTVPGTYTTNPNQIAANLPRIYTNDSDIITGTIKADLGFANFTSLSQYRQENVNQSEALQQVALPIFQLGLPIFDYTTSQEFLLTSKPGPRLQWTAGAYYLSYRDTYVTYIDSIPPPPRFRLGGSSTTTQNIAGYLDATYEITPQLFFTGGVRYAHDAVLDAYYNNPNVFTGANPNQEIKVPSINSTKATPRAVIRYKLTADSNVYASYSEGYKAAILDVGGSCQDASDNYKCNNVQPEDVHAYEVGYKFDNHRFANEFAAFLYNYNNLQVSEFLGGAEAYIVNAARSRIYGLEDDFHFNMNEYFQVNAGFAWTHARYLQFGGSLNAEGQVIGAPVYATCPVPSPTSPCGPTFTGAYDYVNTSTVLHDVHMQHSPDNTATIGPRFSTGQTAIGEFAFSSNLYYTSRIYFSPSGTQFQQPAYTSLAVRGQWNPAKNYYVAVYGDNVANSRYRTQVQYNGFGIGAAWSAPAIWGGEFGVKF
jgi:iron complex outermembrane receptor protein